jgi:dCTP deaminase
MILSQPDLRRAVEAGRISFDPPIEESQWGEASIDLRLGFTFTKLKSLGNVKVSIAERIALPEGFWDTMTLETADTFGRRQTFDLGPREFVLAMTYESVTIPNDTIALVEGRSSYARMGLSMHQTAPWIQPGWRGRIVLEIMNHGPLTIILTPLADRPCQLTFFKLSRPLPEKMIYGARPTDIYRDQEHPLNHTKHKTAVPKSVARKRRR